MNLTQQRLQGYQSTPFLWKDCLLGLRQFQMPSLNWFPLEGEINSKLRLGNYVERLVSYELLQDETIDILRENVQIIASKTTLGEIDCLFLKGQQPFHLEIAYKFYLYDATVGDSFLEHWIGPNRRDSLILKLNKIREKQFPLLYSEACQPFLQELNLKSEIILQRTWFKAQLYIPFESNMDFKELNKDCITGFYISGKQLSNFSDCKFYIPKKLDWLITPHPQVEWINFEAAQHRIKEFHQRKFAPLCWVKQPNGEILKLFITWW